MIPPVFHAGEHGEVARNFFTEGVLCQVDYGDNQMVAAKAVLVVVIVWSFYLKGPDGFRLVSGNASKEMKGYWERLRP